MLLLGGRSPAGGRWRPAGSASRGSASSSPPRWPPRSTATAADPAAAYFVTPTRAWEFGVGALLAIAAAAGTAVAPPAWLRRPLAWAGARRDPRRGAALHRRDPLPRLRGAAAGARGGRGASAPAPPRPARAHRAAARAAARPVLGDISYSVYLWHWPMVVLVPYVSGSHLGRLDKAAIILLTAAARVAEQDLRRGPLPVRGAGRARAPLLPARRGRYGGRRRPRGGPDGRGRPARGHRPGHPRQGAVRWRSLLRCGGAVRRHRLRAVHPRSVGAGARAGRGRQDRGLRPRLLRAGPVHRGPAVRLR